MTVRNINAQCLLLIKWLKFKKMKTPNQYTNKYIQYLAIKKKLGLKKLSMCMSLDGGAFSRFLPVPKNQHVENAKIAFLPPFVSSWIQLN